MAKITKKSESKNNLFFMIVLLCSFIIIGLSTWIIYSYITGIKDSWCSTSHNITMVAPKSLESAQDYFDQGNYDYDTGNCVAAVKDYSQALKLNTKYAEAYNNRAYTLMRMKNYKDALSDLDAAIKIRPTYVNALMNRGDIYNYYYSKDMQKAIADYNQVIGLGPNAYLHQSTCGHRLMAVYNHNLILTFWHLITKTDAPGCFI